MRSLILSLVLCAASTAGAQGLGGPGFGSGADTPGAASTSTANTFAGESTFNAPVNCGTEVISFAATMNIDASTKPCKSISATGNFTLTTSNLVPTRVVTITITADGTDRTMTSPAGWTWVGTTTPGTIVANSTSVIEIRSGTSADSGVRAKYWPKDGAPILVGPHNLTLHSGFFPSFGSDTDDSAFSGDIDMVQHGTFQSSLVFLRTRGTHASPTSVLNGDTLGEVTAQGWAGTGPSSGPDILFKTTEDWATGPLRHGSQIAFQTFKNLNGGFNQWTFDQDGSTTLPGLLVDTTQAALSLGGNAAATADEVNEGITIDNDAGSRIRLIRHSNNASSPTLNIEKSRGTHALPSAVLSGDSLGSVGFRAHDGSSFTTGPLFQGSATETWDATHHGGSFTIQSFKNAAGVGGLGGNSYVFDQDGSLTLPGALTTPSTITANGQFALGITALTPAASVAIDFAATASPTKSLAVSQNTTFTTSNLSAGVTDIVYLTTDGSARTPTWPAGWKWVGSGAPTSLAASTTSVLTLTSTTTADSGVLASLAAQNATVNLSTDVSGGPLSVALGGTGNTTNAGVLISVVKATSGTTITSPSGTHNADVTVCGGGGGGGGTTTAAASAAVGGGGASGSCTRKFYTGLSPLTAYTTSFGAAGTAGSSSGGNGGTGGDATFTDGTTLITGKGGLGGLGETAGTVAGYTDGGAVVSGTNGDWFGGMPGTYGSRATGLIGIAGSGGSCPFGAGAVGSSTAGVGATATGNCAGGAGGLVLNNSTAVAGGAGSAPVLAVRWYQ